MKKLFLIFFISLFSLYMGCGSGQVKTTYDEFKGATVVTMNMVHKITDWNALMLMSWKGDYSREIVKGKKQPVIVSFMLRASGGQDDLLLQIDPLEPKAFVKVDDTTFNLSLAEMSATQHNNYSESSIQVGPRKSFDKSSYRIYTGKIALDGNIEKAIMKSSSMMYRLYSGTKPITLQVNDDQLASIKEFLTTDQTMTN